MPEDLISREKVREVAQHIFSDPVLIMAVNNVLRCTPAADSWIPVTERLPDNFVSVLGFMTDAGEFPPVRECYTVGNAFFFPALGDIHPVSHWKPLPEPPKDESGKFVLPR